MADYTDGLGWAKLDATAACHLADCMDMFQGRAASKRRKMLLFCFSKLNGSKVPCFRLGFRQIAKACDVTNEAARLFLEFCKNNEIFVEVGKTKDGKTPKRTFWWIADGCVVETTQGVLQNHTSTTRGCVVKHRSSNTLQIQSIREGESSKSDLSPRASSVYANAPTDARQKEQPMTGVEFAIAEEEILQRLDKAPHNSPEQRKCSAELTELRNLRDRQKHGDV